MKAKKSQEIMQCSCKGKHDGGGGAVYGLGMIGAVIYFLQHATSFTDGLLGLFKALIWPALAAYELLKFLKL